VSEKIEIEKGFIEFIQVADFADIHDVFIEEEHRGLGLGNFLMQQFLAEMKARNVRHVTLEVRVDNLKAISLYEKSGFEKINVRKNYYQGIDGILMSLDI